MSLLVPTSVAYLNRRVHRVAHKILLLRASRPMPLSWCARMRMAVTVQFETDAHWTRLRRGSGTSGGEPRSHERWRRLVLIIPHPITPQSAHCQGYPFDHHASVSYAVRRLVHTCAYVAMARCVRDAQCASIWEYIYSLHQEDQDDARFGWWAS